MSPGREPCPDRRVFLTALGRGVAAAGLAAASAALLARPGREGRAPCGAAAACGGCASLAWCRFRTADPPAAERKKV